MAITGLDPRYLREELRRHPVIAVLFGPDVALMWRRSSAPHGKMSAE